MIRVELPFPVSMNRVWRVGRHKRSGKRIVYRSPQYQKWIKEADSQWLIQKPRGSFKTIDGSFNARVMLSRPDKRSRDCDNLAKGVLDFAQRVGIIKNDNNALEIRSGWVTSEEAPMGCVLIISPVNS